LKGREVRGKSTKGQKNLRKRGENTLKEGIEGGLKYETRRKLKKRPVKESHPNLPRNQKLREQSPTGKKPRNP